MTTYETNKNSVSREWNYVKRPLSAFPEAKDEYSGFCSILPVRIKGVSNFDEIRSATRNYITKHKRDWGVKKGLEEAGIEDPATMTDEQVEAFTAKRAWTFMRPNDDRYWQCVNDIRNYFKEIAGGLVQPMQGRVGLEIDLVTRTEEDKDSEQRRAGRKIFFTKEDIDNCFKAIQDGLDFRTKTNEGKNPNGTWKPGEKLGLVVDDQNIDIIKGKKHPRTGNEPLGFYWRLYRLDGKDVETDASITNKEMTQKWVDDHQRRCALRNANEKLDRTEKWENALVNGSFNARSRTNIRLALLTNDDSLLDPTIAQHYVALAKLYDRNTAATLVFEEQNRVNTRRALGKDAEPTLCEIEQDVEELANDEDIDIPAITEAMSIRQLNAYL